MTQEEEQASFQEFKQKNQFLVKFIENMSSQLNEYLEEEPGRLSNNYSRSRVEQMHETSKVHLINIK